MNSGSGVRLFVAASVVVLLNCSAVVAAEPMSSLLTNGSFEVESQEFAGMPDGWVFFSSTGRLAGMSGEIARDGSKSIKFGTHNKPLSHSGFAQQLPVEAGCSYLFTAYVMNDRSAPLAGSAYGVIGIEWKDSTKKEIRRIVSPKWDRSFSRTRWEQVRVKGQAPKNAAYAEFTIYLYDGETGGRGSCFVDDMRLVVP
jgi:hypothetical protein